MGFYFYGNFFIDPQGPYVFFVWFIATILSPLCGWLFTGIEHLFYD
jgi:hypothetical protein